MGMRIINNSRNEMMMMPDELNNTKYRDDHSFTESECNEN